MDYEIIFSTNIEPASDHLNSKMFRKTVKGIDFSFGLTGGEKEYFYKVTADNIAFEMHISDDGVWQIRGDVPSWVKELEEELGATIFERDA